MVAMSHRDRIMTAVSLREPDRVPLDLGSHLNCSIHIRGYEELTKYMGIEVDPTPPLINKMMQDVKVDESVLQVLDIDARGIFAGLPDKGNPDDVKEGQWIDSWGVVRVKPAGAHYYDMELPAPLGGEISISDIVNYPWPEPDPSVAAGLKKQVQHLRETTDCALVLNLPSAFVHQSQYMRGFEDWFTDLAAAPKMTEAMFDACVEVKTNFARVILDAVGRDVDILLTSDDMGTQKSLMFSPRMYREMFKPRHKKFFDFIRSKSDAPLMMHSCGSISAILDDLIEIGVQILNPVQTRAEGMDPAYLKKEFGDRIAFWGGMDIQDVLPFGSPEDVRNEVKHLFETLGEGGGWVLCPSHNIQPEVPPENIVAMYEAGAEVARYK
jgi:uroporphyrinogen decarboxylase